MKKLVILVAFSVVTATGIWVTTKPDWDSACAFGAALVAFLSGFFLPEKKEQHDQTQTVGDNSTVIQSGRDTNIR